jgi:trigger factor
VVAERLDKEVDQRLKRLGKNMKMPGFRPARCRRASFGCSMASRLAMMRFSEALGATVQRGGDEAAVARCRQPEDRGGSSESTTHLRVLGSLRSFPEIVVKDLAGYGSRASGTLDVGPTEVDGTIEILRKQRVRYEPVDRAAASGDRVSIDFLGKKDGVPFAGRPGQGLSVSFSAKARCWPTSRVP